MKKMNIFFYCHWINIIHSFFKIIKTFKSSFFWRIFLVKLIGWFIWFWIICVATVRWWFWIFFGGAVRILSWLFGDSFGKMTFVFWLWSGLICCFVVFGVEDFVLVVAVAWVGMRMGVFMVITIIIAFVFSIISCERKSFVIVTYGWWLLFRICLSLRLLLLLGQCLLRWFTLHFLWSIRRWDHILWTLRLYTWITQCKFLLLILINVDAQVIFLGHVILHVLILLLQHHIWRVSNILMFDMQEPFRLLFHQSELRDLHSLLLKILLSHLIPSHLLLYLTLAHHLFLLILLIFDFIPLSKLFFYLLSSLNSLMFLLFIILKFNSQVLLLFFNWFYLFLKFHFFVGCYSILFSFCAFVVKIGIELLTHAISWLGDSCVHVVTALSVSDAHDGLLHLPLDRHHDARLLSQTPVVSVLSLLVHDVVLAWWPATSLSFPQKSALLNWFWRPSILILLHDVGPGIA